MCWIKSIILSSTADILSNLSLNKTCVLKAHLFSSSLASRFDFQMALLVLSIYETNSRIPEFAPCTKQTQKILCGVA